MESLGRGGDGVPCQGLPWGASHEAEFASGCRDLLLGARGEEEEGLVGLVATGRGPRLTFLLLLFFRWDLGNPFDVLLGVPHSKVPDTSFLKLGQLVSDKVTTTSNVEKTQQHDGSIHA